MDFFHGVIRPANIFLALYSTTLSAVEPFHPNCLPLPHCLPRTSKSDQLTLIHQKLNKLLVDTCVDTENDIKMPSKSNFYGSQKKHIVSLSLLLAILSLHRNASHKKLSFFHCIVAAPFQKRVPIRQGFRCFLQNTWKSFFDSIVQKVFVAHIFSDELTKKGY